MREKNVNKKHKVTVKKQGSIQGGSMAPICSCGWKGTEYKNTHPLQFEKVHEEIQEHKNTNKG